MLTVKEQLCSEVNILSKMGEIHEQISIAEAASPILSLILCKTTAED